MGENQFPDLHHRKATDGSYEYWQIVYESYGVMCVSKAYYDFKEAIDFLNKLKRD